MAGEPELKRGDTGEWVAFLNQTLGYHGHHANDGDTFEEKTEHGVRQLQSERGLPETGIMDEASWTALLAEPEPEQYRAQPLRRAQGQRREAGLDAAERRSGQGLPVRRAHRAVSTTPGRWSTAVDFTSNEVFAVGGHVGRLPRRRGDPDLGAPRGGDLPGPMSSPTSTAPAPSPVLSISGSGVGKLVEVLT